MTMNRLTAKLAHEETPDDGHTFRITVACRGASKVVGEEHNTDSNWWGGVGEIEVRAFSLVAALTKATRVPFGAWAEGVRCGGCQGLGAHRRYCPRNPDYHPWRELADRAESIGDSIGGNDPGLANRAYDLATRVRAGMEDHPFRPARMRTVTTVDPATEQTEPPRLCDHCRKPIPRWKRADAETCSKTCKNARGRARRAQSQD